ncbi:MAG TPA: CheR family methyltransferase [Polyangiaceae bacterium]
MSDTVGDPDLERFRAGIAARMGLMFDESKLAFLAEVLDRRTRAHATSAASYLDRLDGSRSAADEVRELARELTVGETYFFRHFDQFQAFAEVALPDRMRVRSASRRLKLLSAGCASGEEPYSMAILLRERGIDPEWKISILGVDMNPAALSRATRAHYTPWSLRETPPDLQGRWFVSKGREYTLHDDIKAAVQFEETNLSQNDDDLWRPGTYDVVFCRNMLMYLTPETTQAVVGRITRALAPGGYLFLGHAETLRGLSHDFHLRHTHNTFYYQRKDHVEAERPASRTSNPLLVSVDEDWAGTWVDTVQRATDRIKALTEKKYEPEPAPSSAVPTPIRSRPDLTLAVELLRAERFSEALDLLGRLPASSASDADVILLRAALLTHGGMLPEAERVCAELIALDDLNAGAHYLLALCREGSGDPKSAVEQDQIAAHLDPSFAMPRLHMGLMARRTGDRETAQRELSQAAVLLQREDASRLLLFGGGFGRDNLTALCRAELSRLENKS